MHKACVEYISHAKRIPARTDLWEWFCYRRGQDRRPVHRKAARYRIPKDPLSTSGALVVFSLFKNFSYPPLYLWQRRFTKQSLAEYRRKVGKYGGVSVRQLRSPALELEAIQAFIECLLQFGSRLAEEPPEQGTIEIREVRMHFQLPLLHPWGKSGLQRNLCVPLKGKEHKPSSFWCGCGFPLWNICVTRPPRSRPSEPLPSWRNPSASVPIRYFLDYISSSTFCLTLLYCTVQYSTVQYSCAHKSEKVFSCLSPDSQNTLD